MLVCNCTKGYSLSLFSSLSLFRLMVQRNQYQSLRIALNHLYNQKVYQWETLLETSIGIANDVFLTHQHIWWNTVETVYIDHRLKCPPDKERQVGIVVHSGAKFTETTIHFSGRLVLVA